MPNYKRTFYEIKCRACHGTGYREYEHGFIRLPCPKCKGTGKVTKEKRIYPSEKSKDDSRNRVQPINSGSPG